MHTHVLLVIATNDAGRALQIADRVRGFKRSSSQVTFQRGHFIIAGTQTEVIVPLHPVVSVQRDEAGAVECTSGCVDLN